MIATIVSVVVVWTAFWLIVAFLMKDPSGDGSLGFGMVAFIWLFIPYLVINNIKEKLFKRKHS